MVFRDIYRLLHKRLGQQTFTCRFREGIKASRIMLLDSSVITLCLNIFNWAHYSEEKGAIKLHNLFRNMNNRRIRTAMGDVGLL